MARIVTTHDRTKSPPQKKRKSPAIATKYSKLAQAARRRGEPNPLLDAIVRAEADEPQRRGRRERSLQLAPRKKIQIYSAGCQLCRNAEATIRHIVGFNHDIEVLVMRRVRVARRAARLGIKSVPAVVVDGHLLAFGDEGGVDEAALRSAIA
jgi:hypothetical protein